MRFYEFEAKALLGKAGVPVAKGGTATTPDEAARIAASVDERVWTALRALPAKSKKVLKVMGRVA
jgi:succinyl-CoA synthetase beta subunit